jgi:hypothetical protein
VFRLGKNNPAPGHQAGGRNCSATKCTNLPAPCEPRLSCANRAALRPQGRTILAGGKRRLCEAQPPVTFSPKNPVVEPGPAASAQTGSTTNPRSRLGATRPCASRGSGTNSGGVTAKRMVSFLAGNGARPRPHFASGKTTRRRVTGRATNLRFTLDVGPLVGDLCLRDARSNSLAGCGLTLRN